MKEPNRLGAAELREEGMTTGKVAAMILKGGGQDSVRGEEAVSGTGANIGCCCVLEATSG